MRKNLQEVFEASKHLIYPSEVPQVLGATTLLRYKIPKLASIFAGNQSCLVLNFQTAGTNGMVSVGSFLSVLQRSSLLIGGQRVINIEECGKYLNHKIRDTHTSGELKDLGTYIYGLNDNNRLIQTFPANANQVSTSDFSILPSPSLQISTTANDIMNYQLQVPLSLVFNLFINDFPMYMLSSNDLVLEFVINNSATNSLLTTNAPATPTSLNLVATNSYVYGVFYQMDLSGAQPAVNLPYTDVFYTSSSVSGGTSANVSFSLSNMKVKRMYMMAQTGDDAILGGYNSSFIDSGNNPLTIQVRYNDNQYFTEPVPTDASAYQYLSECGKHGFHILEGRYTFSDGGFLSAFLFSPTSASLSRDARGKENILGLNFGKVPADCVLYDMSDDMRNTIFDTNPVIVQLRPQVSGTTITKNILIHAELSKTLSMAVGNRSIMVN